MMVPIGAEQSISWQDNGGGELFQSGPKIRDNASNVLGMDGRHAYHFRTRTTKECVPFCDKATAMPQTRIEGLLRSLHGHTFTALL